VEFEDGLSIPVMKKGQLFTKIYNSKSQKFRKKVKPPAHFISNPAPFKVFRDRSRQGAPVHVRVSKLNIQKSKVMEMVSSRFYLQDETMVMLYVGLALE
jgi:hypothetical protein